MLKDFIVAHAPAENEFGGNRFWFQTSIGAVAVIQLDIEQSEDQLARTHNLLRLKAPKRVSCADLQQHFEEAGGLFIGTAETKRSFLRCTRFPDDVGVS